MVHLSQLRDWHQHIYIRLDWRFVSSSITASSCSRTNPRYHTASSCYISLIWSMTALSFIRYSWPWQSWRTLSRPAVRFPQSVFVYFCSCNDIRPQLFVITMEFWKFGPAHVTSLVGLTWILLTNSLHSDCDFPFPNFNFWICFTLWVCVCPWGGRCDPWKPFIGQHAILISLPWFSFTTVQSPWRSWTSYFSVPVAWNQHLWLCCLQQLLSAL